MRQNRAKRGGDGIIAQRQSGFPEVNERYHDSVTGEDFTVIEVCAEGAIIRWDNGLVRQWDCSPMTWGRLSPAAPTPTKTPAKRNRKPVAARKRPKEG